MADFSTLNLTIADTYKSYKRYYSGELTDAKNDVAYAVKGAVRKVLDEYHNIADMTGLQNKGYTHVIIKNTIVGNTYDGLNFLNTEVIVLPASVEKINIVEEDTGIYHYGTAGIKKFDTDHIGDGHGLSYGGGVYLTDTPIPSYGKRYNVDISALNKPYELDIYDDDSVIDYLIAIIIG